MAVAQAVVKGGLVPCGNLERRRGVAAARMAPAAVRIGGSWRKTAFLGGRLAVGVNRRSRSRSLMASPVQMNLAIGKSMRWWEKGLQPNMREIESAQDLVDSLANAGDQLVIVDFFSPGCGGCRALHPKICQIAEQNPDVLFLQVNYEEHKSMCYSLHVHVLPFFRFYRGAQGRLCSFSCTNATVRSWSYVVFFVHGVCLSSVTKHMKERPSPTLLEDLVVDQEPKQRNFDVIKKFRDALAKHKPDRCSIVPTKGLEESELLALAANRDLQFTYTKEPELVPSGDAAVEVTTPEPPKLPAPAKPLFRQGSQDRALVTSGR